MFAMSWWMWALLALAMAMAGGGFAFLGVAAGTAFGTDYHVLTPRQRAMARWLTRTAFLMAVLCGLVFTFSALRALAPLLA
jgi:hypothetical protein